MPAQLPTSDLRAWFLVGPTASGKSAVAQYLAEQEAYDILSADAMLVYIGMDIGTAKPTAAERARVHYYGLDLVEPREPFSAGAYRLAALQAFRDAAARRLRPLIVVGGTGLYIKSLTDGLAPCSPGQSAIREEAERRLAVEGIGALQAWLSQVDPARYASLADPKNPRRLMRALETALAGEVPAVGNWRVAHDSPRILGLKWSLPQLYDRIQVRVQVMFAGGLLTEVERLLQAGFADAPTARLADRLCGGGGLFKRAVFACRGHGHNRVAHAAIGQAPDDLVPSPMQRRVAGRGCRNDDSRYCRCRACVLADAWADACGEGSTLSVQRGAWSVKAKNEERRTKNQQSLTLKRDV